MKRIASLFVAIVAAALVGVIPVQASPGPGNSCPTGGYPNCVDYLNNTEASTVHMGGEQVTVNLTPFTFDGSVALWTDTLQFKTSDGTYLQWRICGGNDLCAVWNGNYYFGAWLVPVVIVGGSTSYVGEPVAYNPDTNTSVTLSFLATGRTPSVVYNFYINGTFWAPYGPTATLSNWGNANQGKVGSFAILNSAFSSNDYTGTGGTVQTFNNTVKEWTGGQWVNWASSHVGPMDNGCGGGITTNCFQFSHANAYTFDWNKLP